MAKITTVTNPLTGQPAQVDQLEHTAQQIDDAVAASTVESTDYTGCYYRMVGSVVEWVNPPMALGAEYRTTERYQGKPVYTMLVNCGTLLASTIKTVDLEDTTARIFECKGYIPSASMTIPVNNINGGSESIDVYGYYSSIKLVTTNDRSSWTAYVTVKYTKTTD